MCAVKDVWSNRIVGYSIDERMTAGLAVSALRSAVARRAPSGTVVVHSDRGSQFRALLTLVWVTLRERVFVRVGVGG